MEIIRLSGYTEEEKFEIARRHLIPETLKENGLEAKEFVLSDEILMKVVRDYTREAGVRNLKREISKLMRKSVRQILQSKDKKVTITAELLEEYLGPAYFRSEMVDAEPSVGAVTGLAWTSVGGETLTIEAIMTHGKGRMTVTGNLKEVMKESISAANGYVRSRAVDLGIKPPLFDTRDIHVHVPEGATPKDGPSAGIGMATAIISVMTGIPVRHDVAMTGEITLRGRVLPIGGLKEKLLAALRFGIKKVLIPIDNVRDLKEIPENVTKGLEIIPVSRMDEVLNHALVRQPEPIEWTYDETAKPAAAVPDLSIDGDEAGTVAH
jgi:ATP-dependent Lon protease